MASKPNGQLANGNKNLAAYVTGGGDLKTIRENLCTAFTLASHESGEFVNASEDSCFLNIYPLLYNRRGEPTGKVQTPDGAKSKTKAQDAHEKYVEYLTTMALKKLPQIKLDVAVGGGKAAIGKAVVDADKTKLTEDALATYIETTLQGPDNNANEGDGMDANGDDKGGDDDGGDDDAGGDDDDGKDS